MQGFLTLLKKELVRFWKVSFQTVAAPVLTALLYQLIFSHAMANHIEVYAGIHYTTFLIPGLAMMSMTQNAFANGSSSLIQSKITGNIVFLLLPPLTALDFFAAYLLAAVVRGLVVGLGVLVVTAWFGLPWPAHPLWALVFAVLGCGALGALGVVAGIWAEKFDQLAAFQNFLIMPLTFLSGVFYSINSLLPFWKTVSHFNPVFYMIDGFRYGFFAQSDTSPWLAFGVVGFSFIIVSAFALWLINAGYKLRH
ncbi:ABC transporter permease [Paludibacterium purpuratum]|uniref:Transport permease protein n=1 Tax=Paludibacterium purpuratum TaxID=1144873 RepID=A0A4R7AWN9_9NEIS|nr:ABC transporter permease [Paludibacterium purpuratum]TDR70541.1 ABC-2 type transport system permease protein [Paludibacterium purpuratum]